MMKGADSPYWKRPQYKALTAAKWDIIIIMLVRDGPPPPLLLLPPRSCSCASPLLRCTPLSFACFLCPSQLAPLRA